jgi:hypothetical protein
MPEIWERINTFLMFAIVLAAIIWSAVDNSVSAYFGATSTAYLAFLFLWGYAIIQLIRDYIER